MAELHFAAPFRKLASRGNISKMFCVIRKGTMKMNDCQKETAPAFYTKHIGEYVVYTSEAVLTDISQMMEWIPSLGEAVCAANPDMRCCEIGYEFCEYPNGYSKEDVLIRHSEAVEKPGKDANGIYFRVLEPCDVLCVMHYGPYEYLASSYEALDKYAKNSGYEASGLIREAYIDGIWNEEDPSKWKTELQMPIRL